ncbi:MAG TPA: hypothetical protein VKT31_03795, partial [Solirubrobacteraceae bacterium]|nr:hypothetical protein [Solirubrobacteraceae bacterium]
MTWRGHMLGVSIDSDCELVGCDTARPGMELPGLVLRAAGALPAATAALTFRADGRPDICRADGGGFVMEAPGLAGFHISPGGETVRYLAGCPASWRWQRYLIGRVLPLAVTLLGREPLH